MKGDFFTMENNLQVFNYNGAEVRTVVIDGDVWFVAKDLGDILGLSNIRVEVSRLDDDEKRVSQIVTPSNGGYSNVTVISESGLYSLIFRSNKPEAKAFSKWVRSEVLPSIRKNGVYMTDKVVNAYKDDPEAFNALLEKYTSERLKNKNLEKKINDDRAFTNLGRVVMSLPGSITVGDAAHFLAQHGFDVGQNRLFKKCRDKKLLCSRKGRQWNKPTQKAIEQGLLNTEISGGFHAIAVVTPKGLKYLTEMFANEEYPLIVLMEACNEK